MLDAPTILVVARIFLAQLVIHRVVIVACQYSIRLQIVVLTILSVWPKVKAANGYICTAHTLFPISKLSRCLFIFNFFRKVTCSLVQHWQTRWEFGVTVSDTGFRRTAFRKPFTATTPYPSSKPYRGVTHQLFVTLSIASQKSWCVQIQCALKPLPPVDWNLQFFFLY